MEQLLQMLKTDLGILSTSAYDLRLRQYLTAAEAEIKREGATTINPRADTADAQLVVMYAAWLWRRRDSMDAMPRMLRWTLNNRIMQEKAGTANG